MLTSLPAPTVTIFPALAMRLATTALVVEVHPLAEPIDTVIISLPSVCARRKASTNTGLWEGTSVYDEWEVNQPRTVILDLSNAPEHSVSVQGSVRSYAEDVEFVIGIRSDYSLL